MLVLETQRLVLRHLTIDDAPFILRLLNEPSFLQYIGDKNVRTLADAREYILTGPVASYEQNGFGVNLVELKEGGTPLGMCGLVKRPALSDPDIGFAFLPEYWNKGYALESAAAVLEHGQEVFHLARIDAIVNPDNEASVRLLEKLGFQFERMIRLTDGEPEIKLYGFDTSRCVVNKEAMS